MELWISHKSRIVSRNLRPLNQGPLTIMSLLEALCVKTSWRALLFRAILGIAGALIVCFDIWRFNRSQQQWNRFWWPPLWFWATRAVFNCACVHEFRRVRFRGARCFYCWGALLFRDKVQTQLGEHFYKPVRKSFQVRSSVWGHRSSGVNRTLHHTPIT